MTFNANNLVLWSAQPVPPRRNLPQWWGYFTTDTIATVEAADYFNLNMGLLIGGNSTWYVGDLLYCVCSNGIVQLQIATVLPNVTTTASSSVIPAASIVLADLAPGIAPSNVAKFGAQYTTLGGAAAEAIAIPGLLATDLPFIQMVNRGPNTVSILFAVATANTLTITFSANPGAGAIINYIVFRAAS